MKLKTILWSLVLIFGISSFSHAFEFKLRALGGYGISIPKDEGLNDFTNTSTNKEVTSFSGQAVFSFSTNNRLGVGLEVGHINLWEYTITSGGTTFTADISVTNINVFFEFSPSIFVLQVGAGYYGDTGSYTNLVDHNYGLGIMLGGGIDIPITSWLRIPILARLDIIEFKQFNESNIGNRGELDRFVVPLRVMAGIEFVI